MYKNKIGLHQRQKVHKSGHLRTIAVDVTNRCNMTCKHCYASTFRQIDDVELDVLRVFFREAYELGVFHYVLQGGEAILEFERLKSIISMIHPDESYINVMSNGWEMDLPMIRALKEIGVDKIGFSLDSGLAAEHDKNRIEGAFERVITAIENVKNQGLFSSISTVVTSSTLGSDGFNALRKIAADLKVRIDIQVAMPVGRWDGCKDVMVTSDQADLIKQLYIESGKFEDGQTYFGRDIYDPSGFDHCPAGRDFMGITASGEILPCNFAQFTLGNVKDTSLKTARELLMRSKWFQGKHPVCLIGEDADFFEKYIAPHVGKKKPLDAYDIFKLREI